MPTPDPTNVLFKIAHPDLYMRNPFNLLNLPIDATAKDIRRRREDVEAAFEAGTEAEVFRHILPVDDERKLPTLDAVHEAFDTLNDPEQRIAYSLFWFWVNQPDGSNPRIRGGKNDPNGVVTDAAIAEWENASLSPDAEESAIAKHNLAIYNHLMALMREAILLPLVNVVSIGQYVADTYGYWRKSIHRWNDIANNPDCWRYVSALIESLNDPRLDYRFARSLRDQFAFAFDQINVELAISFAKAGRDADAKRQVEYMKLSQPEADDVEGTFDDAFAGLQRQTETIVKAAREEADRNPKSGLTKVDEILERTKEPVQISRIVFEKGAPIRESIITTIFAGVRNCMIAYGNETKDWDGCLKRVPPMRALAENDRQTALVAEDEQIITKNKKAKEDEERRKEEEETCWFCKTNKKTERASIVVPMHGNIHFHDGKFFYDSINLTIPRCDECKSQTRIRDYLLNNTWIFVLFLLPLVMAISYAIAETKEFDSICAIIHSPREWWEFFINGFSSGLAIVGSIFVIPIIFRVVPNPNFLSKWLYRKFGPNYQEYPPYKALRKKGFKESKDNG